MLGLQNGPLMWVHASMTDWMNEKDTDMEKVLSIMWCHYWSLDTIWYSITLFTYKSLISVTLYFHICLKQAYLPIACVHYMYAFTFTQQLCVDWRHFNRNTIIHKNLLLLNMTYVCSRSEKVIKTPSSHFSSLHIMWSIQMIEDHSGSIYFGTWFPLHILPVWLMCQPWIMSSKG